MIFSSKKHDKLKESALMVRKIIEQEPVVTFSLDYFWKASEKAKCDGYEDMIYDEKTKGSFYHYANKCEDMLLEILISNYDAAEKLYRLSRIELEDVINEITLEICTKRITLFKIPIIEEDTLCICNAYLQRMAGLLAPFSEKAEKQIVELKEKLRL